MSLPSLGAELAEGDGFLWRQVNDNEAIDASIATIFGQTLLSVAQ